MSALSGSFRDFRAGRAARCGVCGALLLVATAMGIAAAQESPTRHVVVTTCDRTTITGNLLTLASGRLAIDAPSAARLTTKSLILMTFKDRRLAENSSAPQLLLADGDFLSVNAIESDDDSLTVRWSKFSNWPQMRVPLDAVRGLVFDRPGDRHADARLVNLLSAHRDRHDLVLLRNGDTLTGRFDGLDDKNLSIESKSGVLKLERSSVRGLALNPELTFAEPLSGEGALVSLTDGSRFRVLDLRLAMFERLAMKTLFGAEIEIPLLAVESIRFLGGGVTYLSELEPAEYRFEPFFDVPWPLRRDRTVEGGPLRLRNALYPRGLGVHSQCEIEYPLEGKYRRFEATVGIDDDTLGRGSLRFEIHVDGKPAFSSDEVTGKSPALRIDGINVSGARRLTLRVRFGAQADIQDHADWCDALLVK
jgi:NPCBM/NEW2 domain